MKHHFNKGERIKKRKGDRMDYTTDCMDNRPTTIELNSQINISPIYMCRQRKGEPLCSWVCTPVL